MRDLNLTLIQADLHWQNPAANYALYDELIDESGGSSDLIVLPEMFTTGFTMNAADNFEDINGPSTDWLLATASRTGAAICGSLIIRDAEQFYNRLLWATPAGELHTYDKRHLFRMADEQEHYSAGNEKIIVTLGDWRICPLICYDLRFPVWSRNQNDYDLLLYVANWPAPRRAAWETLIPARAVENLCYAVGVNRVGKDGNGVEYVGNSMVTDFLGHPTLTTDANAGAFTTTISLDKLDRYRQKFPAWKDADAFSLHAPAD